MKILLLDDSRMIRLFQLRLLEVAFEEPTIVQVDYAQEAIDYLKNKDHGVDIFISDINLVGMDGLSGIKEIRTHDHLQDLMIIVCSSMSHNLYVEDAYEAGANEFIAKPFRPDEYIKFMQKFAQIHKE